MFAIKYSCEAAFIDPRKRTKLTTSGPGVGAETANDRVFSNGRWEGERNTVSFAGPGAVCATC